MLYEADAVDDAVDRLGVEEERVVPAPRNDEDFAARKNGALGRDDQDVAVTDERRVRDVVLVRAGAKPGEERALDRQVTADEKRKRMGALGSTEGREPPGDF